MSNEWGEQTTSISTAELDYKIKSVRALRLHYEDLKKVANEALEAFERAELEVLSLLKAAGKSKYHVDGLGTVSIRNKYVVRTPKGLEEKRLFFEYIEKKHGPETLMGLQGINFQTLNAFVNAEIEADPLVTIPGLEPPTHQEILTFHSSK